MASSVSKPINCLREDGGWLDQQRDDEVTDGLASFLPLLHMAWALKAAFAEVLYVLSSCKGICVHDKLFSGEGEVTVGFCHLFILTPGV